jgi:3',5'-cyclic-AMP phosphodiesterase
LYRQYGCFSLVYCQVNVRNSYILLSGIVLILFSHSCRDAFEYSPYQVFNSNSQVALNAKNLQRLYTMPEDDTITIALVGDSQRFYDQVQTFIDTVNKLPSIDFVLLAGDITDFGLLTEFELIHEKLVNLNKPYISVIGNHDAVARGEEVFERMFGPLDFSFIYSGVKFVCHNTNSKEFNITEVPNIEWLKKELVQDDLADYFVAVSHIPPYSVDFNKDLEGPYTSLFRETPSFLVSLHAHVHEHTDGYPYEDGIRYITSYSFDQKSFLLLKISAGQVYKQTITY